MWQPIENPCRYNCHSRDNEYKQNTRERRPGYATYIRSNIADTHLVNTSTEKTKNSSTYRSGVWNRKYTAHCNTKYSK